MTPQTFGKYQLLKKLATGGMAEVFLARQSAVKGAPELVVVKRILPHLAREPEFIQMFLNEARIASRFSHPNIAQIYDLGQIEGVCFLAMEFVHGEDLGRVMRKAWNSGKWIGRPVAMRIIASACEGLYYAHRKTDESGRPLQVVHRDISPQNFLIGFEGTVKLVDFGIAKAAHVASHTQAGSLKGKFAYMSPEQAAGKDIDQRSDLFSLGLVFYELLTGTRPLKRTSDMATLQAALACDIAPPAGVAEVSEDLERVVMKALAKSPNDRYPDARAFQRGIDQVMRDQQWRAGTPEIIELMETLFSSRLEEEAKVGHPEPDVLSQPSPSRRLQPIPPLRAAAMTEMALPATSTQRPTSYDSLPAAIVPETRIARASAELELPRGEMEEGDTIPPEPRGAPTLYDQNLPIREVQKVEAKQTSWVARISHSARLAPWVLGSLIAAAFLYWVGASAVGFYRGNLEGNDLFVRVESNLPLQVWVIHAAGDSDSGKRSKLGEAPFNKARGAHLGDTLILENQMGVHEEVVLSPAVAGQIFKVSRDYKVGEFKLKLLPNMLSGLSVWFEGHEVGRYPGRPIQLVEGKHRLEMRGASLSSPYPFDIEVRGGQTVETPLYDLTAHLDNSR